MHHIDYEEFNRNLLLTQAYCESINKGENMASVLRTFNPEYNEQPLFSFKFIKYCESNYWSTTWSIDPISGDDNYLYDELFARQLDHKNREVINLDKNSEYKGRILLAEIDMTVLDGASEAVSNGLVDINDCPPIDTWFYKDRNKNGPVLFAWIPQQYVDLINVAIDVNCVDCLYWYDKEIFTSKDDVRIQELNQKTPKEKITFRSFIKRLFR